jgi:hypothetical protein
VTEGNEQNGRDSHGRFATGNPGGPGGARRRQSELRRAAEEAIDPEHIAAMIRKATRMGLEGDLTAMKIVFERTCGKASEAPAEPVGVTLSGLRTAQDCNQAIEQVIGGFCRGEVDRDAAKILTDAVLARVRAIEVVELDERLTSLEQATELTSGRRR